MSCLLDTDVVIDQIKGKRELPLDLATKDLAMSVITYGELIYGAYRSSTASAHLKKINNFISDFHITFIDINKDIVDQYIQMKVFLERKGIKLDDMDILIAATAINQDLILVTRNLKHFSRIGKVKIYKDPETSSG